ncbi:MAG: helix-turn-helix domain-containing protein [Candidatus Freyarchaeota archaeon]|nr:helix-turn-helix domain-containing protein [Candidatus Jordarchaeia archaeon]
MSRDLLEQACKQEKDPDVKERLLLVLRVKCDWGSAAQAARELHRTKPWVSKWLKKFEQQGLEGLKRLFPEAVAPPK